MEAEWRALNSWQPGRPAKPDPGGYFPLTKGRGELQEPSPCTYTPPPGFLFFWEFFIQAPRRRLAPRIRLALLWQIFS